MQITVEKVVWIALVLVVVAVVGLFLMGQVLTASQQVGQRFYVRLISSQYSDADQSYIISFRIVNTGEEGMELWNIRIRAVGFNSGAQVYPIPRTSDTTPGNPAVIDFHPHILELSFSRLARDLSSRSKLHSHLS